MSLDYKKVDKVISTLTDRLCKIILRDSSSEISRSIYKPDSLVVTIISKGYYGDIIDEYGLILESKEIVKLLRSKIKEYCETKGLYINIINIESAPERSIRVEYLSSYNKKFLGKVVFKNKIKPIIFIIVATLFMIMLGLSPRIFQ